MCILVFPSCAHVCFRVSLLVEKKREMDPLSTVWSSSAFDAASCINAWWRQRSSTEKDSTISILESPESRWVSERMGHTQSELFESMSRLDALATQLTSRIPRVELEIGRLDREAVHLRTQLLELSTCVSELMESSSAHVSTLRDLDRIQSRIESCQHAIQHAATVTALVADLQHASLALSVNPSRTKTSSLESNPSLNEDLIIRMEQARSALDALDSFEEFANTRETFAVVRSKLVESFAPKLVAALEEQRDANDLISALFRIGEGDLAMKEICEASVVRGVKLWNMSRPHGQKSAMSSEKSNHPHSDVSEIVNSVIPLDEWLPRYFRKLLNWIRDESDYLERQFSSTVFNPVSPSITRSDPSRDYSSSNSLSKSSLLRICIRTLESTLQTDFSKLSPSLIEWERIREISDHDSVILLLNCISAACDVVSSVESLCGIHTISSIDASIIAHGFLDPLLRESFRFTDLESVRFERLIDSIDLGDSLESFDRISLEAFQQMTHRVLDVVDRCDRLSSGLFCPAIPSIINRTLSLLIRRFLDVISTMRSAIGKYLEEINSSDLHEEGTLVQKSLRLLLMTFRLRQHLASFEPELRDKLGRLSRSISLCSSSSSRSLVSKVLLHLDDTLLAKAEAFLENIQHPDDSVRRTLLDTASADAEQLFDAIHDYAFDVMCYRTESVLQSIPTLKVWHSSGPEERSVTKVDLDTNFALPPLEYMASASDHLFSLPQQLEILSNHDDLFPNSQVEDSPLSGIYWLRLVASRIVDSFLSYASRISELSPYGAKQLASDTRYLQTMLEALQHTGASTLGAFREIVLTDISSIASSPQMDTVDLQIVNAIVEAKKKYHARRTPSSSSVQSSSSGKLG